MQPTLTAESRVPLDWKSLALISMVRLGLCPSQKALVVSLWLSHAWEDIQ